MAHYFSSISSRLKFFLVSVFIVIIVSNAIVIYQNYKIRNSIIVFSKGSEPGITLYNMCRTFITTSYTTVLKYAYNQNPEEIKYFDEYITLSKKMLEVLKLKMDTLGIETYDTTIDETVKHINAYSDAMHFFFNKALPANASLADSVLQQEISKTYEGYFWKIYKDIGDKQYFFSREKDKLFAKAESSITFTIKLSIISTIAVFIISIFISIRLVNQIAHAFDQIISAIHILASGQIVKMESKGNDELAQATRATNKLSENLEAASKFASDIGKGNFSSDFSPVSEQDMLGKALLTMRDELKAYNEEDKIRDWTNKGIAKFAELLRNSSNLSLEEMTQLFLKELSHYIQANQGVIFITDTQNTNRSVLKLSACYAYDRRKYLEKTIEIGEGLVGQVYLEKESVYLTEVPKDYIQITSGLGQALPRSIFIVPILTQDTIYGVLELASFNTLTQYQRQFIDQVAVSLAATIHVAKVSENIKNLLTQSQAQTESLRSQEEEMRQNLEELMATQEEFERKEKVLLSKIKQYEDEIFTLRNQVKS